MTVEQPDTRQPVILVVDDTPANLQLISEIFSGRGYEIRAALSGRLALQSARQSPPDLILLDVNMPDVDGYEVCRQLKADTSLRDIPIIFISALQESASIVKAFTVGGIDYITKPFQVSEVLARVQTHLQLRRQQQELQENHKQLQMLEDLRDNLVHMIVHDLRNPLWNVHSNLQLILGMKDEVAPAKTIEYTEDALQSAQQLMVMINSILDVSKMESGLIPLTLAPCDLEAMINECIQKASSLKQSRVIDLTVLQGPTVVLADPGLLTRILYNLLSNALHYTSDEAGEIHFSLASDGTIARVTVLDNGQGIPPEYHEKIFEKFFQVESTLSGQRHSTGMGLTFCQLAVEAHGGRIGLQSAENEGSLFWFELPVQGPSPTE